MNKHRVPLNWGPNKFLQTLLSDGIIACMPIIIPNAIKTWPGPVSLIIAWTLRDLVCKRLSATEAKIFIICLAVVTGAVVFASIVWGHTGDVPNIRVLYVVLVLLVTLIHAVVVIKSGTYHTSFQLFQLRFSKRDDQ